VNRPAKNEKITWEMNEGQASFYVQRNGIKTPVVLWDQDQLLLQAGGYRKVRYGVQGERQGFWAQSTACSGSEVFSPIEACPEQYSHLQIVVPASVELAVDLAA
jgi:hypothetical protein